MPAMMVFTSAKSRLMMPGMVMMSEMPCTACRRMSSAMRNDSKKPAFCATASSFSLGMTMSVSTESTSSPRPRSACRMRRLPSKANGLVTTATVSAPISLASDAMMGAAPVPVPPPRPVVTKTMSAPSSASMTFSASSSAALRPTSGLAPAPRPCVSLTPSWIFFGACESWSACWSVLATTNSTPSMRALIMRLTALPPPPPTPITLILALLRPSSWNWMRTSLPLPLPLSLMSSSLLLPSSSGAAGPNTARLKPCPGAKPSRGTAREEERTDLGGDAALLLLHAGHARAVCVKHHADGGGELGRDERGRHLGERRGAGEARRLAQDVFGDVGDAAETRSAAGEDAAGSDEVEHAGLAQVVARHLEELARARLEDLGEEALRHEPRWTIADRRHFDLVALGDAGDDSVAETGLDLLRFRERRTQADGDVVSEVVAADGYRAGVHDDALVVDDEVGGAGADVHQADAELALVAAKRTVGDGERLEDGVVHVDAGAVHRGDDVLRGRGRGGDEVHLHLELGGEHAGGIADGATAVEQELARQEMDDLAVSGQ